MESNDYAVLARDDVMLLAEIGFLACGARFSGAATRIFESLRTLRPKSAGPVIGLAVAHMSAGDPDSAVHLLRDVGLRAHPDDDDVRVVLGVALREAGRVGESEKVLTALAGSETPARRFARALLSDRETAQAAGAGGMAALFAKAAPRPPAA